MRRPVIAVLSLVLCAASIAACSPGDTDALRAEIADARADAQRVRKENEKLAAQLDVHEHRINGLAEDLAHVRSLAPDVKAAAVPAQGGGAAAPSGDAGVAPDGSPIGATGGVVVSATQTAAIRAFLGTDDGRKVLAAAIVADNDARQKEQAKRRIDSMVDRFAKQANLTDDQTKRMKEIMERQSEATRDLWSNMRDLPPDATQEQRAQLRDQNTAAQDAARKQTEDALKILLSTTQYEEYQKQQAQTRRGGVQGGGARRGAPSGN
jgi:hypothetical protein